MPGMVKKLSYLLLALTISGCATTYVPISWGQGDLVKRLSREDLFLSTLFNRYDPDRNTLRVSGASFDEVMMPSEVKLHLGAYRPDTKIIYRNLFQQYTEGQLRSVMLHELAHHVWYSGMSAQQREDWRLYLATNPSRLQAMVRSTYKQGTDFDSEDFAFAVEYARPGDIQELATLKIITPEEREKIMTLKFPPKRADLPQGPPLVRTAETDRSHEGDNGEPQAKDQKNPKDQAPHHEIY